jgi:hypothetical protein
MDTFLKKKKEELAAVEQICPLPPFLFLFFF